LALQLAMSDMRLAARSPAKVLPTKSQAFLPIATFFIARSAKLLSIDNRVKIDGPRSLPVESWFL